MLKSSIGRVRWTVSFLADAVDTTFASL